MLSSNVEQPVVDGFTATTTTTTTNNNNTNIPIPKERLTIHKIVVTNFKSYSGTQTIGPFHQNFTSVVGPNGSGKSNVIDAIMFVLGYRAKKMRQSRLSDLIYQSPSSTSTPIDSCEVSVHFQRILSTPTSSSTECFSDNTPTNVGEPLIVKRVAHRNLKSHYTMNGKTSNFDEIAKRLQAEGIDLNHRRFLILQGEVEAIAMMKPKGSNNSSGSGSNVNNSEEGLLEYLEDIIGTNVLIEPINQKGKELDTLIEEHASLAVRLKHSERECNSLRPEMEKVEHFLTLENELTLLINKLSQIELSLFSKQQKDLTTLLNTQEEELSSLSAESTEKAQKLQEEEKALAERNLSLKEQRGKIAAMKKAFEESSSIILKEKEKISFLKKKRETSESFLAEGERRRREMEGRSFTLSTDCELLLKSLNEKKTEKTLLEEENCSIRQRIHVDPTIKSLRLQIESLEEDLLSLYDEEAKNSNNTTTNTKTNGKKSKKDVVKSRTTSKTTTTTKTKVEELKLLLLKKEEELHLLRKQHSTAKETISQKETGIMLLKQEKKGFTEKLQVMEDTLEEVEAIYNNSNNSSAKNANSKNANYKNNPNTNTNTNRISQIAQDLKRIPGVYGRMGDLCTLNPKYDIAISTAIGSAMDNILVQTTEDGQRAIELLKNRRLGRCNFTILDKMNNKSISVSGNLKNNNNDDGTTSSAADYCPLLSLLKLKDPKYAPAFRFACRSTMVALSDKPGFAEDLAFGRIISGGSRQRVVTMDGRMFETSGTISGGGRPRQGAVLLESVDDCVASTGTADALEQMSKSKSDLPMPPPSITLQQLKALHSETRVFRQELQRLEQRLAKDEKDICGLKDEEITLISQIEVNQLQMQRLFEEQEDILRLHPSDNHDENDDEKDEKDDEKNEDKEKSTTKIKNHLEKLNNLRTELHSSPNGFLLQKGEEKMAFLNGEIGDLEQKLADHQHRKDNLSSELRSTLAKISTSKEDLQKLTADLFDCELRTKEAQKCTSSLTESMRKMEDLLRNGEDAVRSSQQTINLMEQQVVSDRRRISALRLLIEEGRSTLQELSSSIATKMALLDSLFLHRSSIDSSEEEDLQLPTLQEDEWPSDPMHFISTISKEVHKRKEHLSTLSPNLTVIEEWRALTAERNLRSTALDSKEAQLSALRDAWDALRTTRHTQFMTGFAEISRNVKRIYQRLMNGGNAELELVDSLDPFEEGVIFSVMPPRKSWKVISNLSGGEKTISSLSLVFALHLYRPTSCYVMDEIDAALDWRNVGIIAQYVKEQRLSSQFIVISLRNDMFEMADRLVGIYKGWKEQKTRTVCLDPRPHN